MPLLENGNRSMLKCMGILSKLLELYSFLNMVNTSSFQTQNHISDIKKMNHFSIKMFARVRFPYSYIKTMLTNVCSNQNSVE